MSEPTPASAPVTEPAAAAAGAETAAAAAPAKAPKEKKEKPAKKSNKVSAAAGDADDADADDAAEAPRGEWVMPEFIANRIAVWDRLFPAREAERQAKIEQGKAINVTLPDGKVINGTAGVTTPMDIAKGISNSLAERVVVARVNGELKDMTVPLESDCSLQLLDFDTKEGSHVFWHSSAHILGQALEKHFKDARLCIGPPLEEGGFYYDVFLGER